MALVKTGYKDGSGVPQEYWKVIDYNMNPLFKYVDISIGGWFCQECRDQNLSYIGKPKRVRCDSDLYDLYFSIEILGQAGTNPILQMYKFAKDHEPFFADATDLI